MLFYDMIRRSHFLWISLLALLVWTKSADAQITEVWIGVTPTCPYGISACWAGAYGALGCLDGVDSVAKNPDAYNCTAHVHMEHGGLPDVDKWSMQFKSAVDEIYVFRGVEITIEGWVNETENSFFLKARQLETPLTLAPLKNKLQWNYKKEAARQPEPDERDAYRQLVSKRMSTTVTDFRVQVTGPLIATENGMVLEVREFFPQ